MFHREKHKHFYVYKITNLINGKLYIGQRGCNIEPENDNYWGSGKLIKEAIQKYGIQNFRKDIIWIASSPEKLNKAEIAMIILYKSRAPRGYNIGAGGDVNQRGCRNTKEQRLARSKRQTGKKIGSNGFPLYINFDSEKELFQLKILRKHIGYYESLENAIFAKEQYLINKKVYKEKIFLKPTALIYERKNHVCRKKFVFQYKRKYIKSFESYELARDFMDNFLKEKTLSGEFFETHRKLIEV